MADPFGQLVQEHGGIIGSIPINPTVEESIGGTKFTKPNPNPQYRYIFADGTYVIGVNANYDTTTQPTYADIQIIDPGTAMGAKASKDTAPSVRQGANGADYQWNADRNTWEPAPGMPGTTARPTFAPAGQTDPADQYITMYDPASGTLRREANPNYDPEYAALKAEQIRAQIAASNRSGQGSPSEWAKLMWEQQRYPEETAYSRDQDRLKREMDEKKYGLDTQKAADQIAQWRAQNEQAQQNLASSLANWWTDAQIKAAPMAMLPGQEYLLGAEPGGIYANIARMSGRQYDPGQMRAQPIAFDPIAAWRSAQQQVGVK